MLSQLEKSKQFDQSHGWSKNSYLIPKHTIRFAAKDNKYAEARLLYRNCTEGDLSRLYLRVMFGLAEHAGVPMNDRDETTDVWNCTESLLERHLYYPISEKMSAKHESSQSFTFNTYCEKILELAKKGQIEELRNELSQTDLTKTFHSLNLVHHSADESISGGVIKPFKPNLVGNRYMREEYDCEH